MAHYFFDVHSRTQHTSDVEGHECADRNAVGTYALQVLCDIARDDPLSERNDELATVVRDATHRVVLNATLNLSATWISDP